MKLLKFLHYLAGVEFSKRGHLSPVLKPLAVECAVCSEKAQIMHLESSRITSWQLEGKSPPLRICVCPIGGCWSGCLDPMLPFFRISFCKQPMRQLAGRALLGAVQLGVDEC